MAIDVSQIVESCRVPDSFPVGEFGLWSVARQQVPGKLGRYFQLHPYDSITVLRRSTLATMHAGGEVVMEDSPRELKRHLPILLEAHGDVLVTGLGLGCVVRGLLCNADVTSVTVIEKDRDVIRMAWRDEFINDVRARVIHGDAETFPLPPGARFDFGWHDVWSEDENLSLVHTRLLLRYAKVCRRQGVWGMPRDVRRLLRQRLGMDLLEGRCGRG